MFNDNISSYLNFFMVNLKRSETNFLTKKIAFALDLLIERIYDEVKNINP